MAIAYPDKAGKKCGKLTWLSETGDNIGRYRAWNVVCDCGETLVLPTKAFNVHISCGCARRKPDEIKNINRCKLVKEYRIRRKEKGLCVSSGCPNPPISGQTRCEPCRINQNVKSISIREQVKTICFNHYGRICRCCGLESESMIFLTLDHINNDGNEHRKMNRSNFYRWVIKNNFPDNLETSCWNCNIAKHINGGICPHKEGVTA
jgi:hypothetical protein